MAVKVLETIGVHKACVNGVLAAGDRLSPAEDTQGAQDPQTRVGPHRLPANRPVFVNKVLLEHLFHLFLSCLQNTLLSAIAKWGGGGRHRGGLFTPWPLPEEARGRLLQPPTLSRKKPHGSGTRENSQTP